MLLVTQLRASLKNLPTASIGPICLYQHSSLALLRFQLSALDLITTTQYRREATRVLLDVVIILSQLAIPTTSLGTAAPKAHQLGHDSKATRLNLLTNVR
jgi:hypothetical protein